jgi:myo-inositol-hexaphosphate 3-phosphohydrolase
MNNVDLRYNFPLGSERVSLVGVTERNEASTGVRFYKVNVVDRSLTEVGRINTPGRPRGFAMYHSPVSGKYYAFVHNFETNEITQFELDGSTGSVGGTAVRSFDNGGSSEGISADDELQRVYVSEEEIGLWRYGAEPAHGSIRTLVDGTVATGGRIEDNIKNSAIYYGRKGTGYLIVSSQGGSNFVIYNRGDNAFVGSFTISDGGGVDGVSGQDGIDVTNAPLGATYPAGLFTSQDHANTNAGNDNSGNQNHKLVSWQQVAESFSPPLLVDTAFDPRQIGAEGE